MCVCVLDGNKSSIGSDESSPVTGIIDMVNEERFWLLVV